MRECFDLDEQVIHLVINIMLGSSEMGEPEMVLRDNNYRSLNLFQNILSNL